MCIISNPSVKSNLSYSPEMLNSGRNWWFVYPCDLEIPWMTLKNNRAPLLHYIKLCASFQSHGWIQTGVISRKRAIRVNLNRQFFVPCDLEIWRMALKNKRAPLICCFKPCVSFHNHWWIQTVVTVRKRSIRVKIGNFLYRVTLKFRWMTLKNTRAPILCCFKLCASFHSRWWIQAGVTVRKCPVWVKIDDFFFSRVTLKFYRWP